MNFILAQQLFAEYKSLERDIEEIRSAIQRESSTTVGDCKALQISGAPSGVTNFSKRLQEQLKSWLILQENCCETRQAEIESVFDSISHGRLKEEE